VPALATLLLRAGLSFDLLDVEAAHADDFDPSVYRTIFLAAADILPRSTQQNLVAYVRRGGRLVCWPVPPTLGERLESCTVLADACYSERTLTLYPDDAQQIRLLGTAVTAWRGVQTYALSRRATPIATRGTEACGYSRRLGKGTALLLGTWLAADCVPGRGGSILEQQQLSSGASNTAVAAAARSMAAKRLGPRAAALVSDSQPGGQAQELLIYEYGNERRGGDVIAGGALAYWDGQNVVGMVEVNTTESGQAAAQIPYHPIELAHISAVRSLAATTPHVTVSDGRVQARLLSSPIPGTATVMAANRWDTEAKAVLQVRLDGRRIRLPATGSLTLPAGTAVLLPIGYELGHGVTIASATVQLTGASVSPGAVTAGLWTPAGGEVTIQLSQSLTSAELDGKPVHAARQGRHTVQVSVPAGDHELTLTWNKPLKSRRRPSPSRRARRK
jgi:hypothetical protein